MKKTLFSLSFVLLALSACSNADELSGEVMPLATNTSSAAAELEFDTTLFPNPDAKSVELTPRNPLSGFNKLIVNADPKQGLDRNLIDASDEELKEIKAEADNVVKSAKTDVEKLQLLNEWVKKTVKYMEGDNSSYAVFKNKKAICQGYSNLLRAMLFTQNIPSIPVNGELRGIGGHAWVYAYVDNQWYASDPTNSTNSWPLKNMPTHLLPTMTPINIFEDENFVYDYQDAYLNIKEVKKAGAVLVVPYSVNGFRVGSFNPTQSLPDEVRHVYLGSNIKTIGESLIGLKQHPSQDEAIFVDPKNSEMGSENGILYRRDYKKALSEVLYIPTNMRSVKLRPMEEVDKNTIYNHNMVEEVILPQGTKLLGAYAIEGCPNLKRVYLPADCKVDPQALFKCAPNVEFFKGNSTGIVRVKR